MHNLRIVKKYIKMVMFSIKKGFTKWKEIGILRNLLRDESNRFLSAII